MSRYFVGRAARAEGRTRSALRWGDRSGSWTRLARDTYLNDLEVAALDLALAPVVATGGVASGRLAGVLHGLDGVELDGPDFTVPPGSSNVRPGVRRRHLADERITLVGGIRCTSGLQTLVGLAAQLDDRHWEQALESALRLRLTSVADLWAALPALGRARTPGTVRIRLTLAMRPHGAPATESLLETLMVQLARRVIRLADPQRQVEIVDQPGEQVARVDLCWPDLGLFVELDGQHHLGQPVHDASRETAVVAATGWLCGRFTWHEVVSVPGVTARRLGALADQARRRPLPAALPGPASRPEARQPSGRCVPDARQPSGRCVPDARPPGVS